jgi:tRNA G10  N-methylase Trm11
VWDAFCGLGTTLIEAYHMGHSQLLGSDLSDEMVTATKANTASFEAKSMEVFHLDARRIDSKKITTPTMIVTE